MTPHRIRAQLLGLVVAATVPLMTLMGAGIWHEWQSEHKTVTERALQEARLIAAQVDDQLGNLDHLLTGLSRAVSVDPSDSKANDQLLTEVRSELPDFVAHLVLFSPDAYSTASSLGDLGNDPFYAGDRLYFRQLLDGARISIGEPIRGRVTGNWLINIGRALKDPQGRLSGVLTVGILLERFQDALRLNHLPPGTVVRIVAENGMVIAQSANGPNWVGRDISHLDNVLRHMRARESSEVVTWSDGVLRITGSSIAHRTPWLVSVGFPTDIALAAVASRLRWSAAASAIALIAAFAVAWALSGKIVRPIQQLGRDAAMLAAGHLSHRSPIRARDELGELAASFNQMAQALEQRQQEIKRSADEVRQAKDTLAALIENVPVPIVVKETRSLRIILVNRAYEKFLGISRAAMIDKTVQEFFPPLEAQKISEFDKRALRRDEPVMSGEFSVHTPDNESHLISTIRLLVRDSNGAAEHLMVVIDDVTERKKAEEKIWHMAHHDALTGLCNRTQYYERLEQELSRLERGGNLRCSTSISTTSRT